MGQQKTTVSQSGDDATRNASFNPAKKRARSAALWFVAGYLLACGGATVLVLGLSVAQGPLTTVLFLLGFMLTLVGTMIAILAAFEAIFGAVVDATEEAVARMQEKQLPTPPSSSTL